MMMKFTVVTIYWFSHLSTYCISILQLRSHWRNCYDIITWLMEYYHAVELAEKSKSALGTKKAIVAYSLLTAKISVEGSDVNCHTMRKVTNLKLSELLWELFYVSAEWRWCSAEDRMYSEIMNDLYKLVCFDLRLLWSKRIEVVVGFAMHHFTEQFFSCLILSMLDLHNCHSNNKQYLCSKVWISCTFIFKLQIWSWFPPQMKLCSCAETLPIRLSHLQVLPNSSIISWLIEKSHIYNLQIPLYFSLGQLYSFLSSISSPYKICLKNNCHPLLLYVQQPHFCCCLVF